MVRNNPVPALIAAALVLGIIAVDWLPALHQAPLLLLVVAAAVQIDRELGHAWAALGRYPSAPSMNLLSAIVVIHMAYFAWPVASSLLELLGTVTVAMWTLVVVAAIGTDWKAYGKRPAVGHLILSLSIPIVVGGGLGCAFFLQSSVGDGPSPLGSQLVALIVGSAWVGMALGQRVALRRRRAAALVRCVIPALLIPLGAAGLGLAADLGGLRLALAGLATGLGVAVGVDLVQSFAERCGVTSFRWRLPRQVLFFEPLYNRLFAGGLTDYVGPLVLALPLALLALRGLGQ